MNTRKKDPYTPGDDGLYFLPLGGAGEIGMNLSLYGTAGKWLMVDLGVTFADDSLPGVDVIMPDPTFIAERRENLVGLVITHGHEDHIGAIEYLWPQLQCPVFATPFTAALLRAKLRDRNLLDKIRIREIPLCGTVKLGPFEMEWINITHSIPESTSILIKTKHGSAVHTGDWKLDPTPLVGPATDEKRFREIGQEGVLALVIDSTNAMVPGHSKSESDCRDNFVKLFPHFHNRIIVTCFSSNVARILSIYHAAKAVGRETALIGRSLWRIEKAARETGYIPNDVVFLNEEEAGYLPREKAVYICTGSQGENRSALAKLANDEHPELALEEGDVVLFSSREIPGNEKAIAKVQNALVQQGIRIVTDKDTPIHVSGHPCQDELTAMYQWVRPQVAVPVHGETRHQMENARIASSCQVPHNLILKNGSMVRLGPGQPEKVGEVQSGRWVLDGLKLRPFSDAAIKDRQKMMWSGLAVVTLVVDEKGRLVVDPQITLKGFGTDETESDELNEVHDAVIRAFETMPKTQRVDDVAIQHTIKIAVRRTLNELYGKKPVTDVHVMRID
jgi:ribonuclease J